MRSFIAISLGALAGLGAGSAIGETVEVSDEVCAAAIAHVPGDDVAFKPGVDVGGNAVAPADLPSRNAVRVPGTMLIELSVPLGKDAGGPAGKGGAAASMPLGSLAVDIASGRVVYNGEPLGESQIGAVADACRKRTGRG